jgi:hypothetical protein
MAGRGGDARVRCTVAFAIVCQLLTIVCEGYHRFGDGLTGVSRKTLPCIAKGEAVENAINTCRLRGLV